MQGQPSRFSDFTNLGCGVLMGGADIIPGVSGGTVALILGIYERLVRAISHFDLALLSHLRMRRWREAATHVDLRFVAVLGCGIVLSVVGLASLMNYLLQNHQEPTFAVFFGLILASSLVVARDLQRWSVPIALWILVGAAFAYWLVGQSFLHGSHQPGYLFFCGMIGICAMILPGISGAFILLIMGEYEHITGVLRGLLHGNVSVGNVVVLLAFLSGCVVGLLSFSKFLRWLLARFRSETMAVLCGFMIGSLRRIWPFKEGDVTDVKHEQFQNAWPNAFTQEVALVIVLAVVGFAFVLCLEWVTRQRRGTESPPSEV